MPCWQRHQYPSFCVLSEWQVYSTPFSNFKPPDGRMSAALSALQIIQHEAPKMTQGWGGCPLYAPWAAFRWCGVHLDCELQSEACSCCASRVTTILKSSSAGREALHISCPLASDGPLDRAGAGSGVCTAQLPLRRTEQHSLQLSPIASAGIPPKWVRRKRGWRGRSLSARATPSARTFSSARGVCRAATPGTRPRSAPAGEAADAWGRTS